MLDGVSGEHRLALGTCDGLDKLREGLGAWRVGSVFPGEGLDLRRGVANRSWFDRAQLLVAPLVVRVVDPPDDFVAPGLGRLPTRLIGVTFGVAPDATEPARGGEDRQVVTGLGAYWRRPRSVRCRGDCGERRRDRRSDLRLRCWRG